MLPASVNTRVIGLIHEYSEEVKGADRSGLSGRSSWTRAEARGTVSLICRLSRAASRRRAQPPIGCARVSWRLVAASLRQPVAAASRTARCDRAASRVPVRLRLAPSRRRPPEATCRPICSSAAPATSGTRELVRGAERANQRLIERRRLKRFVYAGVYQYYILLLYSRLSRVLVWSSNQRQAARERASSGAHLAIFCVIRVGRHARRATPSSAIEQMRFG